MPALLVYVTAGDAAEAERIGRQMVEERLAACANVLGGVTSIYRWEGAVEQAAEAVLILKTEEDRFKALSARIRALHSYALPCVVALPLAAGDPAYLAWIAEATREP